MRRSLALFVFAAFLAPAAAQASTALFAGAGPRFSGAGTEAVGSAQLEMDLELMFDLRIELDGYLSGPGGGLEWAGLSAGLMFEPPIPGPFMAEIGVVGGLANMTLKRHGEDSMPLYLAGEAAVGFALGPLKTRLAYQHVFTERVGTAMESQLMFSVGLGI